MQLRSIVLSVLLLGISAFNGATAQRIDREPGGRPEDTVKVLEQPFEYAWELFFYLNQQAKPGAAGLPDTSKNGFREYDNDKDVIWESWARASGGVPAFMAPGQKNYSEVFLDRGAKPTPWDQLDRGPTNYKVFDPNLTVVTADKAPVLQGIANRQERVRRLRLFSEPASRFDREFEVRMNRSTYETVVKERLYSVEGLEEKFRHALETGNRDIIKFDRESKEIKAKWIEIKESDKPRYHWRVTQIDIDGRPEIKLWGLAGLHIITKDIPNWFWTDFAHVDYETTYPDGTVDPRPSIDPTTNSDSAPAGRNGIRTETIGTKWEYYRLRGIQIEMFDKFGTPTELANILIEPLQSGPSSCMTCHARASVGLPRGEEPARPLFAARTIFPKFVAGAPDPELFENGYGLQYIQTDFLWSMVYRAHREN